MNDLSFLFPSGLRVREKKEVYEGEVTELVPVEVDSSSGTYGKVVQTF